MKMVLNDYAILLGIGYTFKSLLCFSMKQEKKTQRKETQKKKGQSAGAI